MSQYTPVMGFLVVAQNTSFASAKKVKLFEPQDRQQLRQSCGARG